MKRVLSRNGTRRCASTSAGLPGVKKPVHVIAFNEDVHIPPKTARKWRTDAGRRVPSARGARAGPGTAMPMTGSTR